jgi:hypothetical protein
MVPVVELPPCTPFTSQVTAVLVVPVTVAANCWVWEACTDAEVGEIDTATAGAGAVTLTVALADFVLSAMLLAVTVTALDGAVAGAV